MPLRSPLLGCLPGLNALNSIRTNCSLRSFMRSGHYLTGRTSSSPSRFLLFAPSATSSACLALFCPRSCRCQRQTLAAPVFYASSRYNVFAAMPTPNFALPDTEATAKVTTVLMQVSACSVVGRFFCAIVWPGPILSGHTLAYCLNFRVLSESVSAMPVLRTLCERG